MSNEVKHVARHRLASLKQERAWLAGKKIEQLFPNTELARLVKWYLATHWKEKKTQKLIHFILDQIGTISYGPIDKETVAGRHSI